MKYKLRDGVNLKPLATKLTQKGTIVAPQNILQNLSDFLCLLPAVRHSPSRRLQASYDEGGDVLCVHFGRQPRLATDSDVTDDDIIVHYDGDEITGITILHASQR